MPMYLMYYALSVRLFLPNKVAQLSLFFGIDKCIFCLYIYAVDKTKIITNKSIGYERLLCEQKSTIKWRS